MALDSGVVSVRVGDGVAAAGDSDGALAGVGNGDGIHSGLGLGTAPGGDTIGALVMTRTSTRTLAEVVTGLYRQ